VLGHVDFHATNYHPVLDIETYLQSRLNHQGLGGNGLSPYKDRYSASAVWYVLAKSQKEIDKCVNILCCENKHLKSKHIHAIVMQSSEKLKVKLDQFIFAANTNYNLLKMSTV